MFKGQKVTFYDAARGFWRTGICYQETKQIVKVRDISGKRYHVPNNSNNIQLVEKSNGKENATT